MAKKKNPIGTAVIEYNHSGIPDSALEPEEFNAHQIEVLEELAAEVREKVNKGIPMGVIDLESGTTVEAFNMQNVAPTKQQIKAFAREIIKNMIEEGFVK